MAFPEEPELGVDFSCGSRLLSLRCGMHLEELMPRWNPYVDATNQPRMLANFDDGTLGGCFRFRRVELEELAGILDIPAFFKAPGSGPIFKGGEALLIWFLWLAERQTSVWLAEIIYRTPPTIS